MEKYFLKHKRQAISQGFCLSKNISTSRRVPVYCNNHENKYFTVIYELLVDTFFPKSLIDLLVFFLIGEKSRDGFFCVFFFFKKWHHIYICVFLKTSLTFRLYRLMIRKLRYFYSTNTTEKSWLISSIEQQSRDSCSMLHSRVLRMQMIGHLFE